MTMPGTMPMFSLRDKRGLLGAKCSTAQGPGDVMSSSLSQLSTLAKWASQSGGR